MDDQNYREGRRWLRQAEEDLKSSKDSFKAKHYEWACFQAQQSGEKALKSLLYSKGVIAITHSLRDLVVECKKQGFEIELFEEARFLDAFYISTRYPNSLVGESIPAEYYSEKEAEKCIRFAESMLKKAENFLKE